jgi:quinoprotein glucose dehydrogenase
MRPVSGITDLEINAVIAFLAGGGRGGGRGAAPAGTFPPGPVVATGGAPVPAVPTRTGPLFGGAGPTGGNFAYPEDAAAPPARYSTGYNVMGSSTAPPYSRLTAYDLNTGTIKWQVPVGDDLTTVSRGGPTGTGAVGLRTGIMPTKSGLVFLAGGDGKVRAYDEDDGKILWTGTLPGGSRGVPVIYQSQGREYVVIASTPGGRGGRAAGPPPVVPPDTPRGYIAFALPK